MDPVTHTLVGASLAATRLGERTRFAAPALVIGANLPDIDVLSYFRGSDFALGFRRGWTHGVLALVILPALLALAFLLWERLRRYRDGSDRPVATGWLVGLCYLATLTHPFLDWLNVYGMRWWMPFNDTWYYGDSVFIMDPWLWLVLGVGWLVGRRATRRLVTFSAVVATLLLYLVVTQAPVYLPVILAVVLLLLVALLWRPDSAGISSQTAALAGLLTAGLFIASMLVLHQATRNRVLQQVDHLASKPIDNLMVGPTPANPTVWEVIIEQSGRLRHARFSWIGDRTLLFSDFDQLAARSSDLWPEILASGQEEGFLSWVRFPWMEVSPDDSGRRLHIMDARYSRARTRGFGGAVIILAGEAGGDSGSNNSKRRPTK